jgi:hypothetical protein
LKAAENAIFSFEKPHVPACRFSDALGENLENHSSSGKIGNSKRFVQKYATLGKFKSGLRTFI